MKEGVILVTGADGFIGRRLCRELERQDHQVVRLGRDHDIVNFTFSRPDLSYVFHLAAKTFVPESWQAPARFYETNVLGTVNVLELCRRQKIPLTFISSYLYGAPVSLPISESHRLEAFNPYGHSKLLAEQAVRFYARHFCVPTALVRPFNIFGPGQEDQFLIPTLLRQALDPEKKEIRVADDRPKRDYLHVDDLVSLLLAVLSRDAQGVFNAGSGHSTAVSEVADIINRLLPRPKPLVCEERSRPNEVFDVVADITKAQRELGWQPQISLEQGIAAIMRTLVQERGSK